MSIHWHASIENVILYGVSAIIVINLLNFAAARMAASNIRGIVQFGEALGAVTPSIG